MKLQRKLLTVLGIVVVFGVSGARVAWAQFRGGTGGIVRSPGIVNIPRPGGPLGGSTVFPNPMEPVLRWQEHLRQVDLVRCGTSPCPGDSVLFGELPAEIAETRDQEGRLQGIQNRTGHEVKLASGLVLGPWASLEFKETWVVTFGYAVSDGVKRTADGAIDNVTNSEVRLSVGTDTVIIGPLAAVSSDGTVLRGYVVAGGKKYEAPR